MSRTFSLSGRGNTVSVDYFPAIELNSKYNYVLGLVGFYGCNSIRNIFEGNNRFYFQDRIITIPSGSYEIQEIADYLQKRAHPDKVVLQPNNNTLKCELSATGVVDFTQADSIGRMLGFSSRILPENILHESDLDVRVVDTTNINVECNITSGSYRNHSPSHTIFEFDIHVESGFRLVKEPSNVIYLPVSVPYIDNITLKLVNHRGQPIDFGEEEFSVLLELKQYGSSLAL